MRADHRVLLPHPACEGIAEALTLTLKQDGADLLLRYAVQASAGRLLLPPPGPPVRADSLWRHTCCELFVAAVGAAGYREFNFSPSGAWAVYDFSDYREALPLPDVAVSPAPSFSGEAGGVALDVRIDARLLPAGQLEFNACAVLESASGALAYWALHHPVSRPDFHHRDGFVGRLRRT